MNKVLAGLQIIAKYDEDFDTCAEHDEFYAGAGDQTAPSAMSDEDQKIMNDNGWHWDGESWRIFT